MSSAIDTKYYSPLYSLYFTNQSPKLLLRESERESVCVCAD